jgi:hypothetical protein
MERREVLRLGIAGLVGQLGPVLPKPPVPVPRVNGGINVQPLRRFDLEAGFAPPLIVPELVDAQMQAIYELGFEQIRITISFGRFGPDFLGAIPYARAARALGIDVLGVIGQFTGFDLVQALSRPGEREEVLEVYFQIFAGPVPPAAEDITSGRFAAQVLNEPTHFLGISPESYVEEYLAPAYDHLKEDAPDLTVVSAAPIGSAVGVLQARAMIEAGLERHCDRVAFHVYGTRFLREISGLAAKPVWITESGAGQSALHLDWMTSSFERIRSEIPAVERIFWFDLFDHEPDAFRLIDVRPRIEGGYEPVVESVDSVGWLRARTQAALAGKAPASYRELVPDIMLYLPTENDLRIIRSTSIGSRTWGS